MANGAQARGLTWVGAASRWVDRAVSALFVLGLGVLLGYQYMSPDKRVLSVLVGLVVAGIAWRLEIVAGIGVMLMAMPWPKGTVFGSTNLALILLLLVIFLLRVGQRELPFPRRSPIDMPILALVIATLISFYNVSPENMSGALANFELFLGTVLMFVVVVNSIQTERDLERVHQYQVWALVPMTLISFWELAHPGKAIVPGWIDFTTTGGKVFNTRDVRIGGPFHDYELLADFCGLNLLFLTFLLSRARSTIARTFYGALLGATVFLLFSTVTRGPLVSLAAALLYLLWAMRRRLRVVPTTIVLAAVAAAGVAANFVVANFTRSGNLFTRLSQTEFQGLAPDTRAYAWQNAWQHFLIHPIIGWGPFYSASRGLYTWFWPHNLYLYIANTIGVIGFGVFAWMLWKLFALTRPTVDMPNEGGYAEGYMLLARAQLVFFLVDQFKIEYLRNPTYQYQVWMMFALWVAGDRLRRRQTAAVAAEARPAPAWARPRVTAGASPP